MAPRDDNDIRAAILENFEEHGRVMTEAARTLPGILEELVTTAVACLGGGGKLLVCGNGGSAADAQHLATELVCRYRTDRPAVAAIALTTDSSALTAIANDYGYERVFARQVEALARPGDMLVAISTSGNSPNVIEAARQAKDQGCTVVGLTGGDGGRLAEYCDLVVAAPSRTVARIQEVHEVVLHVVAEAVERAAGGDGWT